MPTPDIGRVVLRCKNDEWVQDACIQIRLDYGKFHSGATKVTDIKSGNTSWADFALIVWASDLSRHKPQEDIWKSA